MTTNLKVIKGEQPDRKKAAKLMDDIMIYSSEIAHHLTTKGGSVELYIEDGVEALGWRPVKANSESSNADKNG